MRKKSKMRAYAFLMAMVLAITTFLGDASAFMPAYAAGEDAQAMDDKFMPDTLSREGESAGQEITIAEWTGTDTSLKIPITAEKNGVVVGTWNVTTGLNEGSVSSSHGVSTTGWNNLTEGVEGVNGRMAWAFTFDASGYTGLKFSAIQRSSNTGPKN